MITAGHIPCSAPRCRRTCKAEPWCEWLCQKHWTLVPKRMRQVYSRARRRRKSDDVLDRLWFRCKAVAIREVLMGFSG